MSLQKYYRLLGLKSGASLSEIKSAYRKMAFKFHPDRNLGNPEAEEKFKEILEAYEELNKVASEEVPPKTKKSKRKPVRKKASRYSKKSNSADSATTNRKKNLRYNVFVSLEEVVQGSTKIIRYIREKNGTKENIQLKVQIPKGSRHLQRLKVSDFGDVGSNETGDLFVIVHHQPHPIFEVDDNHLSVKVPITYLDALLGTTIKVPSLEGPRTLELTPCQFQSIYHELPNCGLPDGQNSAKRGHLFVECFIDQPDQIDAQEKNRLVELVSSWPTSEKMKEYRNELNKEDQT